MKNIILAIAALTLLQTSALAQGSRRHHKKYRGHHKTTYYYDRNRPVQTDATRPSAYKGDKVPENDGVKKNKQRNLNYNNGQPMPSNSGK